MDTGKIKGSCAIYNNLNIQTNNNQLVMELLF